MNCWLLSFLFFISLNVKAFDCAKMTYKLELNPRSNEVSITPEIDRIGTGVNTYLIKEIHNSRVEYHQTYSTYKVSKRLSGPPVYVTLMCSIDGSKSNLIKVSNSITVRNDVVPPGFIRGGKKLESGTIINHNGQYSLYSNGKKYSIPLRLVDTNDPNIVDSDDVNYGRNIKIGLPISNDNVGDGKNNFLLNKQQENLNYSRLAFQYEYDHNKFRKFSSNYFPPETLEKSISSRVLAIDGPVARDSEWIIYVNNVIAGKVKGGRPSIMLPDYGEGKYMVSLYAPVDGTYFQVTPTGYYTRGDVSSKMTSSMPSSLDSQTILAIKNPLTTSKKMSKSSRPVTREFTPKEKSSLRLDLDNSNGAAASSIVGSNLDSLENLKSEVKCDLDNSTTMLSIASDVAELNKEKVALASELKSLNEMIDKVKSTYTCAPADLEKVLLK